MDSDITPDHLAPDLKSEPPTIFDPATCTRKGLCPVTQIRKQGGDPFESHSLYYEIHGSGPEKVVFIMGYTFLSLFRTVLVIFTEIL